MSGCPDIPDWEHEWLDDRRRVSRRGPFRCVTHTGGASHGIGSAEIVLAVRLPDMGVAIEQTIATGRYLDDLTLDRTRRVNSDLLTPRSYGTYFHGHQPMFDGHTQAAEPGNCDLMGGLPCWSDVTYLWDDAFDVWLAEGEGAVWPVLEERLIEWSAVDA